MKNVVLCFVILLAASSLHSQPFPPNVTFSGTQSVCDYRGWRLVLNDDFNGSSLASPWITFKSYAGMRIAGVEVDDFDDWSEGRYDDGCIIRDENVIVGGGMVKLLVKRQTASWRCSTCVDAPYYNSWYTVGTLRTPYHARNFNSGKFEARIQMPDFRTAHSTFWTWWGSCVNEIDIAEAYGKRGYVV